MVSDFDPSAQFPSTDRREEKMYRPEGHTLVCEFPAAAVVAAAAWTG